MNTETIKQEKIVKEWEIVSRCKNFSLEETKELVEIEKSDATNDLKETALNVPVHNKEELTEQKESSFPSKCLNIEKHEYETNQNKNLKTYQEHTNPQKTFTDLIIQYLHCATSIDEARVGRILNAFSFENNKLLTNHKWRDCTTHFGNLINDIFLLLLASTDTNSSFCTSKSVEMWNIIVHTIETVTKYLPTPPKPRRFPWGQNWYQFTIMFPRLVVFAAFLHRHLFDAENECIRNCLNIVILNYLPTPRDSIGWKRGGPNSIMMAVSYIGAHLYLKDLETNLETDEMQYVFDCLSFERVTNGEGLYHDGGFIFHTNLRAYGYIYDTLKDMRLLALFFKIDCLQPLINIPIILEHPTIKMHFGPLFTRRSSLHSKMCGGEIGFYSMDSVKVLSCKTEEWMLQFNGQHNDWCFYEADQENFAWSQYWTMARQFYYKDTDKELRKEFRTYYPGIISYDNRAIDIKSSRLTTETFKCKEAKCITVVLCGDQRAAAMYNCWNITQFNLSITELILITQDGYSVIYKINPEMPSISSSSSSPKEPIVVSVNFGKYDEKQHHSSLRKTSIRETFSDIKIYPFKHNRSVIHLGRNEKLFDCKRTCDGQILQCLQCEPNSENLVAFSTFHSKQSNVKVLEENKIISPPYTLVYNKDMLWLYDQCNSTVSIGQYTEYPVLDLFFDQTIITDVLGPEVQLQDGILKEMSFETRTSHKRSYGVFVNVDDEKFQHFINNI